MEVLSPRRFVLASLKPSPSIIVNTNKAKEHATIEESCVGTPDPRDYSLITTSRLIAEILSYKDSMYFLKERIENIIFWRQTEPSLLVFATIVLGVEKPQLWPSIFFMLSGCYFFSVK